MVLLDTGTPGTSREIYSEDADHGTRTAGPETPRNPSAQWLEHSVYNQGVASSSPIIGILTVNFSTGTRSSCVQ